jgi:hypothetical protein
MLFNLYRKLKLGKTARIMQRFETSIEIQPGKVHSIRYLNSDLAIT